MTCSQVGLHICGGHRHDLTSLRLWLTSLALCYYESACDY